MKELLLAACILMAIPAMAGRAAGIDGAVERIAYLGLAGIMWLALIAAAYIPNSAVRTIMGLLLAAAAYYFEVYQRATAQFMTYDAFINMKNSAAFMGDAFKQNRAAFMGALPGSALLLVAIIWPPRRRLPLIPGYVLAIVPWLGLGLLTGVLFLRGGEGARGMPSSFPPIAYLALAGYEGLSGNIGPRRDVAWVPDATRSGQSIVLIIDESIAAKYLDINSPGGVPTPLSRNWPQLSIMNFGIAASVTTCSVGSNVTLRYGGTREDYQRINAVMPSIWAYARKAGLQTVYIDAQRTGGYLQNMMDDAEQAQIDRFIQFDTTPVQGRDMAIAQELVKALADPAPKFILVNKIGAHFPVHDKFPDSHMHYQPVLPRGQYADISDTGSRAGFGGTAEEWRRYRNSYRNTLSWNVGEFFEHLLMHADLSRATVIYTADHGQMLHEDGSPGLSTHCNAFPVPEEGAVPLVAISGKGAGGDAQDDIDWNRALAFNGGRSSHYMIFPTLLRLMGYDARQVSAVYGPSLADEAHDPVTFNALFNARLNRKPVWMAVDPVKLPDPPPSDYSAAGAGKEP